jgi:hypothetical protein
MRTLLNIMTLKALNWRSVADLDLLGFLIAPAFCVDVGAFAFRPLGRKVE